ncbi:hypothetical protein [Bizionia echini]|nr:hypothetical protein [Bizionia echini]
MPRFFKTLFFITFTSLTATFSQSFNSSFEEEIFKSYKRDSINYNFFKSMFAIDSLANNNLVLKYQDRINTLLKTFPEKENKEKKEQKRIKFIYDEIHSAFFNKYKLDSYFNDLFEDGTYNCVTASALYAYAFDELQIPYHIKETPTHVFIIAYPETYKIYLETTVPGEYGFIVPKESEIIKVIDELISYKLITKEEVLKKGYMKFYEDLYYGHEFVNKNALVGMQYYNRGLSYLDIEDYDKAINNLRKSKIFFSSPLIKPIIKTIMFDKINELEFNSFEDIDYLLELIAIANYPEDYSLKNLESSLFKLVNHDDNTNEFIEASVEKFNTIKEDDVRNTALEFLYEYLAKQAGTDENLDDALKYSDKIINLNPNSKIAQKIIEYVCFKKIALSTLNKATLNELENNVDKYPFIKSNNRYHIALAHLYGNISLDSFGDKDIESAHLYLKKLEDLLDNNDITNEISKKLISNLYTKAGNYYYYKEQHKSAFTIYSKGLSYAPNDHELNKRAKWSKEEL